MPEWTTNAAIVAFVIITIGDKVLNFLKTRGIDIQLMSKHVKDLHEWHDHDELDQPGVKIWWNQKYIARLIEELSKLQTAQTNLLSLIHKDALTSMEVNKELVALIRKMNQKQDLILSKVQVND